MARVFIKEVKNGETYRNVYLLKEHSLRETKTGKDYLDLTLMDSTGELKCKMWDVPAGFDSESYIDGDFVAVDFTVGDYNGSPQGKINMIRHVIEADVFNKNELIPCSARSSEEMYRELYSEASSFKNSDLRRIVCTMLERNKDKLMTIPAARSMHHYYLGGLLEHTCEVLRTAKALAAVYECNEELLFAGAIIHDIAKIVEFEQAPTGLVADYTARGKLVGHVNLGVTYVESICHQLNINGELKYLLQHMVLSHHGRPEYGSPITPAFLEAMLLHESDVLSAKAFEFKEAISNVNPGEFSPRIWGLENSQVYHFREDTFKNEETITEPEGPLSDKLI